MNPTNLTPMTDDADDESGSEPLIDVPDGWDREAAENARSTTPDDERIRCPECGNATVTNVVRSPNSRQPTHDKEYRCMSSDCLARFDTPD